MANDFDVVTVRVQEETGEVMFVIVTARPRSAVVRSTSIDSCLIARVNGRVIWCCKRDVKRTDRGGDVLESENGVVSNPEPGSIVTEVPDKAISETSENGEIEPGAAPDVADGEIDVVDHSLRPLGSGPEAMMARILRIAGAMQGVPNTIMLRPGAEPLGARHSLEGFDCSKPSLNDWLSRHGRQAQGTGSARTFVVSDDGRVAVCFSLTVGQVDTLDAPERFRKGIGQYPITVVIPG